MLSLSVSTASVFSTECGGFRAYPGSCAGIAPRVRSADQYHGSKQVEFVFAVAIETSGIQSLPDLARTMIAVANMENPNPATVAPASDIWTASPTFREVILLTSLTGLLFVATILPVQNYRFTVDEFGDSSAYMSVASAIRHWDFRGLQIKQFWGYPYAIALLSALTHLPERYSLLVVSCVSSFLSIGLAYWLWGGWVAAFFAVLNFDWMAALISRRRRAPGSRSYFRGLPGIPARPLSFGRRPGFSRHRRTSARDFLSGWNRCCTVLSARIQTICSGSAGRCFDRRTLRFTFRHSPRRSPCHRPQLSRRRIFALWIALLSNYPRNHPLVLPVDKPGP